MKIRSRALDSKVKELKRLLTESVLQRENIFATKQAIDETIAAKSVSANRVHQLIRNAESTATGHAQAVQVGYAEIIEMTEQLVKL